MSCIVRSNLLFSDSATRYISPCVMSLLNDILLVGLLALQVMFSLFTVKLGLG